jgi:SAM-dependent methyltransferase
VTPRYGPGMEPDWLVDTRTSYDTVAADYTDLLRGAVPADPYLWAALSLFAQQVRAAGGGPVADVGCGPGHVTADLRGLGVDAFGVDLSPAMITQARREHPGVRFDVGSMTELALPDDSVTGLLAWWSLIHVPEDTIPLVLKHFRHALRPGGRLLVGFHVGDTVRLKTEGYGGHLMRIHIHRRTPDRMADLLRAAGFTIDAHLILNPDAPVPGALLFAN